MIAKRCEKCGATTKVAPRVRRCKALEKNALGPTGFWCYGKLVAVAAPAKPKKTGRTLEQELARAHVELAAAITRVKRAVTSVDGWQRRIKSIGRRIDERDHPTPKKIRPPKPHHSARAITLPNETSN